MLAHECIEGIQANKEECASDLENSSETVTDLTPIIGYEAASHAVKKSLQTGEDVYKILKDEGIYDKDAVDNAVAKVQDLKFV